MWSRERKLSDWLLCPLAKANKVVTFRVNSFRLTGVDRPSEEIFQVGIVLRKLSTFAGS